MSRTKFKSIEAFQKYLRNGHDCPDLVTINGTLYTMDEYDMPGRYLSYGNKRTGSGFTVETSNRYKQGMVDAELSFYEEWPLRNDINYFD